MDGKVMVRQMMEFNKTAFDNGFAVMVTMQEQAEKIAATFLDQAHWLPAEGKKIAGQWMGACKQGREGFKNTMDESYGKLSTLFDCRPKSE